jgi:hypothetical protein
MFRGTNDVNIDGGDDKVDNMLEQQVADVSISTTTDVNPCDKCKGSTELDDCTICGSSLHHEHRKLIVPDGVLKKNSSYPRPKTADDVYPTRMKINGVEMDYTVDKFGNVVPFSTSFWFANRKYEIKAVQARNFLASRRNARIRDAMEKLKSTKETEMKNRRLDDSSSSSLSSSSSSLNI